MSFINSHGAILAPTASASRARMLAAGLPADGVTSSLRDKAEGVHLFLDRYAPSRNRYTDRGPFKDVRIWNGKPYKRMHGLPVAVPGTSKHELGLAMDVNPTSPAGKWLLAHGAKYGWSRPMPNGDPVHWEFNAAKDTVGKAVAARPITVPKPTGRALLRDIQSRALGVPRTGHMDAATVHAWFRASRAQVRNVQTLLGFARTGIKTRKLHAAWADLAAETK